MFCLYLKEDEPQKVVERVAQNNTLDSPMRVALESRIRREIEKRRDKRWETHHQSHFVQNVLKISQRQDLSSPQPPELLTVLEANEQPWEEVTVLAASWATTKAISSCERAAVWDYVWFGVSRRVPVYFISIDLDCFTSHPHLQL